MNTVARWLRRPGRLAARGTPHADFEDWGLSAAKLWEVRAELDDHVRCLEREEGRPAAHAASERIARPAARRALAAPHIADQVYATLNRWPTRQEWLELAALAFWYALIVVADLISLRATFVVEAGWPQRATIFRDPPVHFPPSLHWLLGTGWLMQAVGRAGFFTSLLSSLARAWRTGTGVWLARVLQLKLIHTLLVVSMLLLAGEWLWKSNWYYVLYDAQWPLYLTAPYLLAAAVALGLLLLVLSRLRWWRPALFVSVTAGFLWAGGPAFHQRYSSYRIIAWEAVALPGGEHHIVPSTDPKKILAAAERTGSFAENPSSFDLVHNRRRFESFYEPVTVLNVLGQRRMPEPLDRHEKNCPLCENVRRETPVTLLGTFTTGPQSAPGAGLGWLALPIPILGLIGLAGMLWVMGRRGMVDSLVYSVLCMLALASTVFPFVFSGLHWRQIIELSKFGLIGSPLPGFDSLLIGPEMSDSWLLIAGLVLSAGVPWLLTGLFLRPRRAEIPPDSSELAE